jgi:hypothetical protein
VIQPGQQDQLDVRIGMPRDAGVFQQSVKLFFDDGGSSSVRLTVSAQVR